MIILDTNVVSELMRPSPSSAVIDWLEKYPQTDFADTQIAAIAVTKGARIATRNTDDFRHAGIEILNPWMS